MPVLTGHAEVCATFVDPTAIVPPARSDGSVGTLNWLRASVCRFSNGQDHARRRALVEAELERTDTGWLQRTAAERTRAVLAQSADKPIDIQTHVARPVPVGVLAAALGVGEVAPVVESVIAVAAVYLDGLSTGAVDAHVARLVGLLAPGPSEAVANRVGILVQACNATAALIENTLRLSRGCTEDWAVDALLAETLRYDPPARSTQRIRPPDLAITLDLAAANRDPLVFEDADQFRPGRGVVAHLGFGYGPRSCPGQAQACALAHGVLEVLLQ